MKYKNESTHGTVLYNTFFLCINEKQFCNTLQRKWLPTCIIQSLPIFFGRWTGGHCSSCFRSGVMAERNPFYFWERQTAASVAADHPEEAHLFLIHLKCALYLSWHPWLPPPPSRAVTRTNILRPPLENPEISNCSVLESWNISEYSFVRSPLLWTQGTICFCFLFVCFRRPGVRPNIVLQGHLCYECRDTKRFYLKDLEHVTIQLFCSAWCHWFHPSNACLPGSVNVISFISVVLCCTFLCRRECRKWSVCISRSPGMGG